MNNNRTIKVKLKHILKDDKNYSKFFNCIKRANTIAFICSNFIRSYILYLFNNNNDTELPKLNYDFIRMAFKSLSKETRGPKPKGKNLADYNKLCSFYDKEFSKLLPYNEKFDSVNLSYIFNLAAIEMETSYINNIKLNFFKYLNQYVNQSFIEYKRCTKDEWNVMTAIQRIEYNNKRSAESKRIKELKKELHLVKQDLINNTLKSADKYHEWIINNRDYIFPKLETDITSYYDDIEICPLKYLKHMLIMNELLENKKKKLFQPICLRTELTDKYIAIDSSVLKEIFTEINNKITNAELWNKYFNINPKKYKIKGYSFNHLIYTDGVAVSINFIKTSNIAAKNKKIAAKAKASKETKRLMKNKTEAEITQIKKEKEEKQKKQCIMQQKINKERSKKNKEAFKKLSKEEQEKIRLRLKKATNKYEYIEDAVKDKDMLKMFKDLREKIVTGDPGCRDPLTLLGKGKKIKKHIGKIRKDNILYSYTNSTRLRNTKRLKYMKLLDNYKKKIKLNNKTIKFYETELSNYNCKTVNYKKFNKFIKLKIKLRKYIENNIVYNNYVKKLKWFSYINKKRHEDKLLNEIAEIYGDDAIFVLGDWSKSGCIKYISTPNMRMKKLLASRFEVYLIDEYNTSQLYYKTEEKGDNLKVNIKYKIDDKVVENDSYIHSILTFKMSNNRSECINRDYNATLNMQKIVSYLLEHKERPAKYKRIIQPVVK